MLQAECCSPTLQSLSLESTVVKNRGNMIDICVTVTFKPLFAVTQRAEFCLSVRKYKTLKEEMKI